MAFPTQVIDTFAGQNWLITPAALAKNEPPPPDLHAQKWLLTLSGVGMVNLKGNSEANWLAETLLLRPTILDPMHYAISTHGIPKPPGTEGSQYTLAFQVEQWSPYASISSIFNQNVSNNSGFAVDVWRPDHFDNGIDIFSHQPVGNLYTGLQVDVAVRDTDAWLYRVGYNILLLGRIVFLAIPETLFQSDFNPTAVGQPPAHNQAVGTANVIAPPRSVIVINPPAPPSIKWVQIAPGTAQQISAFQGVLTNSQIDGLYVFSATILMAANTGVASISFETAAGQEFMHLDLMPSSTVRIDDGFNGADFGTFPRGQPFVLRVTLNSKATGSTAHIVLSSGAFGTRDCNILSAFQPLSRQFGAIRLWQGTRAPGGPPGTFDATNITVGRIA
jgi:hypothetical protein